MATAGQDGKVIIWDVAFPPRDGSPATTTEGAGDGTDVSTSNASSTEFRRRTGMDALASPDEDAAVDVSTPHQGIGAANSGGVAPDAPKIAAARRGETYLDTESTSTAPSDDGSGGRGSSELGLAGGSGDRKEQGFPGSEVRKGMARHANDPDWGGRFGEISGSRVGKTRVPSFRVVPSTREACDGYAAPEGTRWMLVPESLKRGRPCGGGMPPCLRLRMSVVYYLWFFGGSASMNPHTVQWCCCVPLAGRFPVFLDRACSRSGSRVSTRSDPTLQKYSRRPVADCVWTRDRVL